MANVETLISQVGDPKVRADLAREIKELKKRLDWGLVFERHLPENTRLLNAPIKAGSAVWERRAVEPRRFRVRAIEGDELVVVLAPPPPAPEPADDAPTIRIPADVLVERDFSEPVFPAITSLGSVRNGPPERPSHAVIEGENFHALEMLLAAYTEKVDCLYLDPPYNTGARDWSYNNDYVDPTDRWRHSKWLAFMERRLALGRKLLKPNGVMVVTIDENEVHHLGMLLDQMFPEALRQMVAICINPSGASNEGLSRVDEYAFFIWFGGARPTKILDDLLGPEVTTPTLWESLLRRGSSWTRTARPNLCYPVLIDAEGCVAGVGARFEGDDEAARPLRDGDHELAWPVRSDGRLGIWRVDPAELRSLSARGYAYATKRDERRGTWSLKYVLKGTIEAIERGDVEVVGRGPKGEAILRSNIRRAAIAKTMWHRGQHTAGGAGGTQLVTALIGERGAFSYPKSVYAVRDTLDTAVGDRPDGLILDFFAGSGTTLHATMLLNAADDGQRRCVLVTNNEVRVADAVALNAAGQFRGDPEFEAAGVFESACRPRVEAAVRGKRVDGMAIEGMYLDGRDYADGFAENVEFFRLDYLDPARIDLGLSFTELHPLLWLAAGGVGEREEVDPATRLALPAGAPYAVLFDPSGMPELLAALAERSDLHTAFIVADSERGYARLIASLRPTGVRTVHLYRDYLEAVQGARS